MATTSLYDLSSSVTGEGALTLSVRALESGDGGPCAVVSLAGRVGIGDRAWFRDLLELQAAQHPGRMVADLSRLSSIDWWAALILVWAGRVIRRRGGTLALASPQPAVARVLTSVGAQQVMPVYDSVQQAGSSQVAKHHAAR